MMQSAFQYPASLTEKYRPLRVSEFGDCPNLARLVKESNNNARESLQRLEIALLDR